MPPTRTRTNHMPSCRLDRWEGSSRQFVTAMATLATIRAKNNATKTYFQDPRSLWSLVLPIRKSQKSVNGLAMAVSPFVVGARENLAGYPQYRFEDTQSIG